MNEQSPKPFTSRKTWTRLFFILLFGLIYGIAELIVLCVIAAQFAFLLFTGDRNQALLEFGAGLSKYTYQVLLFMTFNSEDKPFPFAPWPSSGNPNDSSSDTPKGYGGYN